jgi:hypothetical protein
VTGWHWSAALTGLGLASLVLAPTRPRTAAAIGIVDELLWIAYAITTRQWAFCLSALAYAGTYARNLRMAHAFSRRPRTSDSGPDRAARGG